MDSLQHGVVCTNASYSPVNHSKEADVLRAPIRIDICDPSEKLPANSSIDYGKMYEFKHNSAIRPYGVVSSQDLHVLIQQWASYHFRGMQGLTRPGFHEPSARSLEGLGFNLDEVSAVNNILKTEKATSYKAINQVVRARAKTWLRHISRTEHDLGRLADRAVHLFMTGMDCLLAIIYVWQICMREKADGHDGGSDGEEKHDTEDDETNDGTTVDGKDSD